MASAGRANRTSTNGTSAATTGSTTVGKPGRIASSCRPRTAPAAPFIVATNHAQPITRRTRTRVVGNPEVRNSRDGDQERDLHQWPTSGHAAPTIETGS